MWRAANAVISGLFLATGAITVVAIAGISVALAFWPDWHGARQHKIHDPDDINELPKLILKLQQHTDPVGQYLWSHFSEATRRELMDRTDALGESEKLRRMLAADFNTLIHAGPIYDPAVFAGVALSPKTQALLLAAIRRRRKCRASTGCCSGTRIRRCWGIFRGRN